MKIEIANYKLSSRTFLGNTLKLIFRNTEIENDVKVLQINAVAGFFDFIIQESGFNCIRIDEGGGSYNQDLSMRLRNPELVHNKEVFIFTDNKCVNFCFRCSARDAVFRDWTEADKWLK
jgi:hypothetical protein